MHVLPKNITQRSSGQDCNGTACSRVQLTHIEILHKDIVNIMKDNDIIFETSRYSVFHIVKA